MRNLKAVVSLVLVAGAVTGVLLVREARKGGAESSRVLADDVVRALSAKDADALAKVANPAVPGRYDEARKLVAGCQSSDLSAATADLRGGFGDNVAWADVAVPGGAPECRRLTFTLSRIDGGWYLALGSVPPPAGMQTAATTR
jgi:hypothetical protein